MSSIDCYQHRLLEFIECPSSFDFINGSPNKKVAIYELLENIPGDERDFDGKIGDILLGGGSGEAAALRISIPQAMLFFFHEDWDDFEHRDDLCKAFWTPNESYIFGDGYSKLGWSPESDLVFWLAENLCTTILERFDQYEGYKQENWHATSKLNFFDKDFFTNFNK